MAPKSSPSKKPTVEPNKSGTSNPLDLAKGAVLDYLTRLDKRQDRCQFLNSKPLFNWPLPDINGIREKGSLLFIDQSTTRCGLTWVTDGLIAISGSLELANGKHDNLYTRMANLQNVLLAIIESAYLDAVVMEGGVDFNHRSVEAARGCTVARYTVGRVTYDVLGKPPMEINNNVMKASVVDPAKLQQLKSQGLRNDKRPLKCDVIPGVMEILGIERHLILDEDHGDSLALAIAWFQGAEHKVAL